MSGHERNSAASDAILQRHIHVKSFAKMDHTHQNQNSGHQGQNHQGQGHQGHPGDQQPKKPGVYAIKPFLLRH
jgi:hypothetical protein